MKWVIVGALVVLLFFVSPKGQEVVTAVTNKIKGGKIVGPTTPAGADGIVPGKAEDLAKAAGYEKSIYALARMVASEHGSASRAVKVAIAWVARNEAKARGYSIFTLLTKSRRGGGQFGAQSTGRYASTRLPAREEDIDVAVDVISGAVKDPTNGARRFYSPKAQDQLFKAGKPGYTKDAKTVEANWQKEGWKKVVIAEVSANELTFFSRSA